MRNPGWSEPLQKEWFLQRVSEKRMDVAPIISHRVPFAEAPAIYKGLIENSGEYLGVVFDWTN